MLAKFFLQVFFMLLLSDSHSRTNETSFNTLTSTQKSIAFGKGEKSRTQDFTTSKEDKYSDELNRTLFNTSTSTQKTTAFARGEDITNEDNRDGLNGTKWTTATTTQKAIEPRSRPEENITSLEEAHRNSNNWEGQNSSTVRKETNKINVDDDLRNDGKDTNKISTTIRQTTLTTTPKTFGVVTYRENNTVPKDSAINENNKTLFTIEKTTGKQEKINRDLDEKINTTTDIEQTSTTENENENLTTNTSKTKKSRQSILLDIKNETVSIDIKDFPYIVSILKEMIHSCCGTIISSSWVLTAAHCLTLPGSTVQIADVTKIAVVAGQSQLGLGKMQVRRVKNLYLNSRFVKKMLLNDIGLINLYEPFDLNEYVNVVSLSSPISKPYKFFSSCHVVSWTVYRKDFLSFDKLWAEDEKTKKLFQVPELQLVNLPTISGEECSKSIEAKEFITRNHICTEYGTFKNVSCATDAGSPLVCGDRQYGIFSWGIGCEDIDLPGVFTKVSVFRKWIDDVKNAPEGYVTRNRGSALIRVRCSALILYRFMVNFD